MKVKVLKNFKDKHTGKVHKKDEVFICNKERFKEILSVGKLVEEVKAEDEEPEKTE